MSPVIILDEFGVPHAAGYLLKINVRAPEFYEYIAPVQGTVTATNIELKKDPVFDVEGCSLVARSLARADENSC